ncbi:MAG: hypothetical protein JXB36_01505 [Gammaproteobacteria bacterium]|nr:hypothetical protein [Gammaproteobacteria bacterium]
MRLAVCIVASWLIGCAGNPSEDTGPVARCETTDCFYERDVRSFQVVNRSTIVVYVGQQRCPFVVELDGLACDVSIAPQIHFFQLAVGRLDRATGVREPQVCSTTRGLYAYTGILDPSLLGASDRIDPVTGRPGGFGRTAPGGFGRSTPGGVGEEVAIDPTMQDMCRVRRIRSMNDDQLLELYADEGVMPPPPPIGHGQLEVPESADEPEVPAESSGPEPAEEGAGAGEGAGAAPSRRSGDPTDEAPTG